ncbi:MAG: hypothetical protein J6S06_00195 [Alphaproteobacteria bacterium]|nr:hypothetical protein [Alphaproteobacteria bacterium]
MSDITTHYARVFSGPSGRAVLMHLRKITIERFLPPDATDAQLRSLESQRALVHQIEKLSAQGQTP